ncbi:30S ribosomal protein S6e [archaeon]|nr:30S ribosomal protein S6e [archaeon]|tara:strand:- start:31 stop:432 length:402 start_codon:yes stop_codon:yes gene_type:complete
MAELRFVINDSKSGKSYQKALETEDFDSKKIGETVKGDFLGLEGYELQITGGSDYAGFPMRKDIEGTGRKRALLKKGVGFKKVTRNGIRKRKTVCGNTITNKTVQVNLKVTKEGSKKLEETFAKKEEEKPAEQ